MKTRFILLILLAFLCFSLFSSGAFAWWNNSFARRKPITINNTENTNSLTDYQVGINLTYDSDMQTDFSDIRFTWYNSTSGSETKIPYWIEEKVDSNWAYVWIKVPSIQASGTETVYVYYKNATSVSSESNGEEVFIVFDDFNDNSLNTTKWSSAGSVSESSQVIKETGNGQAGVIKTASTHTQPPIKLEGKFKLVNDGLAQVYFVWDGLYSSSNNPYNGLSVIYYASIEDKIHIRSWSGGTSTTLNYTSQLFNLGQWYKFKVTYDGSTVKVYLDDVEKVTYSITKDSGDYSGFGGGAFSGLETDWDDVRLAKYTDPEPTYSTGSEQTYTKIHVNNPKNMTYYVVNITSNFSVESFSSTFHVKAYSDGVIVYNNSSYQNNETVSVDLTNLGLGSHNFTVWANDSGTVDTKTVIFTVGDFNFIKTYLDSPGFEVKPQNYTIEYNYTKGIVKNITTTLYFDGVKYYNQNYTSNSTNAYSSVLNNTITFQPPLISSNNTNFNVVFENNITYENGTSILENQTTTQKLYYAFFIKKLTAPSRVLEGQTFNITTTLTNETNINYLNGVSVETEFNSTNSTASKLNYSTYYATEKADYVSSNTAVNYISYLNISFKDDYKIRSSSGSLTVYNLDMSTTCGTVFLNVTVSDEVNTNPTNADIDMLLESEFGTNHTIKVTNKSYVEVCVTPTWANFTIDGHIVFQNNTSSTRTHYLFDLRLQNSSVETIKLYTNDLTTTCQFTLRYGDNTPASGLYLIMNRYFVGTNSFRSVTMAKSDDNGYAYANIEVGVGKYYRQIVRNKTDILQTSATEEIVSCPKTLTVTSSRGLNYFNNYDRYNGNLSFNNATNITSFSFIDKTGASSTFILSVFDKYGNIVCNESETVSSGTLICSLGNLTSSYSVVGYTPGFVIDTLNIDYFETINFGVDAVILGIILVISSTIIGLFVNILTSLLLTFSVILLLSVTGILKMGATILISLLVIIILILLGDRNGS